MPCVLWVESICRLCVCICVCLCVYVCPGSSIDKALGMLPGVWIRIPLGAKRLLFQILTLIAQIKPSATENEYCCPCLLFLIPVAEWKCIYVCNINHWIEIMLNCQGQLLEEQPNISRSTWCPGNQIILLIAQTKEESNSDDLLYINVVVVFYVIFILSINNTLHVIMHPAPRHPFHCIWHLAIRFRAHEPPSVLHAPVVIYCLPWWIMAHFCCVNNSNVVFDFVRHLLFF